ncbi:MAG TPA: hypothetical protein PKN99_03265 [Cyclobacteriaceae bacterium]|jgi:chromosome segregation ATPase|nr:hypothetical protein [Cyclobacteriaceae bacterium]
MIKKVIIVLSMAGILGACDFNPGEKEKLRSELDSLKIELSTNQEMASTLEQVGVLMDSIDVSRNVLRTSMLEGTSYDEYARRMEDLHEHVKKTQAKIDELENAVKSSRSAANNYASALKKLKAELKSTNEEMIALQTQVDRYRNENENLVHTVDLQKAELADKLQQLSSSQDEIANLELNINQMLAQSKIDEAEAYYLRAEAMEMAANRTHFAPRKKKETRKEALELYRLASFYGKEEAKSKIEELEEKI